MINIFKKDTETVEQYLKRLSVSEGAFMEAWDYHICTVSDALEKLNMRCSWEWLKRTYPKICDGIDLVMKFYLYLSTDKKLDMEIRKHPIDKRILNEDLDFYDEIVSKTLITEC